MQKVVPGHVGLLHSWMVSKDEQIEPWFLPVDGQHLQSGTEPRNQAGLDISARSVWNVLEQAFFDVRVFHAPAPTYTSKEIPAMYLSNENEKKQKYLKRIIQIE